LKRQVNPEFLILSKIPFPWDSSWIPWKCLLGTVIGLFLFL
jgi:hypothetical protein